MLLHCRADFRSATSLSTPERYAILHRTRACTGRRDVRVMAFGLGDQQLRLVLRSNDETTAHRAVTAVKIGTSRSLRHRAMDWGGSSLLAVRGPELARSMSWAHQIEPSAEPLCNPWTSHRDLLGFRRAHFFQAPPIDPSEVHRLCRGGRLPGRRSCIPMRSRSLNLLLRVSAAVYGVLPNESRCFRLFVSLARRLGWRTEECAKALMLTPRRIRQLAQRGDPLVEIGLVYLRDERLAQVP